MSRINYIVFVAEVLFSSICAFAQNEENTARKVTFRQEGQGVVIEYRIPATADVSVFYSDNGGKTYYGPLISVTGDVGRVKGEGTKKVYWMPMEEVGGIYSDNVCFKVVAVPVVDPLPAVAPVAPVTKEPEIETHKPEPQKQQKASSPSVSKGKKAINGILSLGAGVGIMDGSAAFAGNVSGVVSLKVSKQFALGIGAGFFRVPNLKTYQYSSSSFTEEAKVYGGENILSLLADLRILFSDKPQSPYLKMQGGPGIGMSDEQTKGKILGCAAVGIGYPIYKGLSMEAGLNFSVSGDHVLSESNLLSLQPSFWMPVQRSR